jgi:hypothetical protein
MAAEKLSDAQKRVLQTWEPRLRTAARKGDYAGAKRAIRHIQEALRPTAHETRLQQAKNWLFEAAMESGNITTAISGFIGVREKTRPTTRVYLEATALLAICHLRRNDFSSAEPLMAEALRKDGNISSLKRRAQFRRRMIDRFETEWVISTLRAEAQFEALDPKAVESEVGKAVMTQSEDDLYESAGRAIPPQIVERIFRVYDFARNQVPPAEQQYLPSPKERRRQKEVGKTVVGAVKQVMWKSLCDPDNEIYKQWHKNGLDAVLDKKILWPAVVLACGGVGFARMAVVTAVTALMIKFGIDVFCEWSKPEPLMIARDE